MEKLTYQSKREIAEGTMEFTFSRPEGFNYQAGQTIDLTLINLPEMDAEGNMRTFSLVSAPHEPVLKTATRMRDTAFKRTLKHMEPGTEIGYEGPFGSFLLHENTSRPAVFLAGGIGITPFHSMISDATHRALPHTIFLFYSNRRPEDAAFLDELQGFAEKNPNFTLVATMTDMEKSNQTWEGERGYIDASMLSRHLSPDVNPVYYLAGPQTMVTAMRTMLNGMGVSNDDIRFEEFAGY
ncbi:MAG: ferredoxin--NADP reductase [Bacillota bacterium]